MPQFAWVAMAIMLLLILTSVDSYIGGWLLIVIVMGMVYGAHKRNLL